MSRNFFDENNNLFLSLLTSESSLFNKFIFDYLSLNDSKLERERDLLTAEYEKLTTWSAERGFLRLEDLKIKTVSKKKADLICQHRNNYAILALFGKKQNDEHITEILYNYCYQSTDAEIVFGAFIKNQYSFDSLVSSGFNFKNVSFY